MAKEIYNFANRKLCEYASIFPDTATLMEHMFFVIGNGYEIDPETGIFAERGGDLITKSPKMTPKRWEKLIADCRQKEISFMQSYSQVETIDEAKLEARCQKYYPRYVDEYNFTEAHFYQSIKHKARERLESRWGSKFVRPYPLSGNYSAIFKLDEKSPAWMVQLGYNLSKAWVKFLSEEIAQGHVAPDTKENTSPEDGYATLHWTQKHLDMLKERVEYLQNIRYAIGTKVRVAQRDPDWTYAGCAEPMPGMKGVVVKKHAFWEHPLNAGKIALEFDPRVLGYEDDGDNDPVTIFFKPEYLEIL